MTYCLTCDYQACERTKIKDLFKWLNVKDDTCSPKIARINRILRNFYIDTIDFDQNIVSQEVVCAWDMSIETEYPIYKLRWFYWVVTEDNRHCSKQCIAMSAEDHVCRTCSSTPQETFLLKTYQTNGSRQEWQYTIACDNVIHFNPYSCFDKVFLEYSRWPLTITTVEDEIELDSKMLIALEYLIEAHYALRDDEYNRATKYEEMYTKTLQKILNSDTFIPYSVWASNSKTSKL